MRAMSITKRSVAVAAAAAAFGLAAPARADFPFPTCDSAGCADASDFGSYLFLAPGQLPNDFDALDGDAWKYNPGSGMDLPAAWLKTTGRPDTVVAILDSGLLWNRRSVSRSVWLNVGELPIPPGCDVQDCNGDGFVGIDDFDPTLAVIPDWNANGFRDGQDLIKFYSDGVDGDGNGFVDDIAGWDFHDHDNDAFDDVDYGHGSGEADDQVSEANDGGGLPGFSFSSRHVPLRVNDSFVAIGTEFTQAVVYATDLGVDIISEALGTLSGGDADQAAIDYAYGKAIPIIASAADEESRHHNLPAALAHTIWVNSIVHPDGTIVQEPEDPADRPYDLLNGCTNFGGRAWVAISSNSCSSEATGRAAGMVSLLISHGKNLMDDGALQPYPGTSQPFSAEEIRQLLRKSAEDIDRSANLDDLVMLPLLQDFLAAPGVPFASRHFPTQPGWDQYTGYGRPNAGDLLDVTATTIPPEADLSGSLRWFATVDPVRTKKFEITGSAAAVRAPGKFKWRLDVGCGIQPLEYRKVKQGKSKAAFEGKVLAKWKAATTAKQCGFDPAAVITDPDGHTVTLRLTVEDSLGNVGEDRRVVAIHTDATLKRAPKQLGASAESPAKLVDLDGDGNLDIVLASSDGAIHAFQGATGEELPGFPAHTNTLPVGLTPGFTTGAVPVPRETVIAPSAADDLDGDGKIEIVVASTEGRIYVYGSNGARRTGFPVTTNPAFSNPENRNRLNDSDRGVIAAPTLGDLDNPPDGKLEILVSALDGYLYAWNANGVPRPGFPVRIADPAKVALDPATGAATPLPGMDVRERGRKLLGSPAVGDLDGDGNPEIVATSNEEYGDEDPIFTPDPDSGLTNALLLLGGSLGGFDLDVQGRIYAVHNDGNLHAGGPFRTGWPVKVPTLVSGLLPTVATGTPGAPALADLDGPGPETELVVAIFGSGGPVVLINPDGTSFLGTGASGPFALATDFAEGFPNLPSTTDAVDAPFFAALGAGAFGDMTGDGVPEYVAPLAGIRELLDVSAPASQEPGSHMIGAFDPLTGEILPGFPRNMDDMQFLTSPSIADVSGDGNAEIIQGSGGYLLRAFDVDGIAPAGWPKFTHGWLVASPAPGDVDDDGLIEVVAATREGNLYVWETPAPATPGSVQWQGFGGDRRNSQNWSAGLATPTGE
jgi:hypothetical protein